MEENNVLEEIEITEDNELEKLEELAMPLFKYVYEHYYPYGGIVVDCEGIHGFNTRLCIPRNKIAKEQPDLAAQIEDEFFDPFEMARNYGFKQCESH
ncbi:hypothetical protein [Eubacterium limosum]|uniref:hypothetical protein n=1 Tax=Eubacterium limosum TaxID=1736 RepID=UPI001063DB3A|nr:hypothetical protein [Eubacterium limosum]